MSQDRTLDEILIHFALANLLRDNKENNIDEAKQAILEVMRGCVPNKLDPTHGFEYENGYNNCRAEVLRRIEEVGK